MSLLTVLVGLPGSGKSTFTDKFIGELGFTPFIYSTDQFIEDAAKHFNITYNEAFKANIGAATKTMDSMLEAATKFGVDVIWDQTNMSPKKRRGITSKVPNTYMKSCYCIIPPRNEEEWVELNRRLASRSGKTIPQHIVQQMASSYVEPELDEGFDRIFVMDMCGKLLTEKGTK